MAISANLKDTEIAQGALEAFVDGFAPVTRFSTNFSSEFSSLKGDTVQVPLYSATGAAEDYDATKGFNPDAYSTQSADATTVSVTINKRVTAQLELTVEQLNEHDLDIGLMMKQKAHQLAKSCFQYVLGVVTNADYGAAALTSTAANFDAADLTTISTALNANEVPKMGRFVLMDCDYMDELTDDTRISDGSAFGSYEAIRDGRVPRVKGFDLMESFFIPSNSENLVGLAGRAEGIAVAQRVLDRSGMDINGVSFVQSHPESGLAFTYRRFFDDTLDKLIIALEWYGGRSVGIATAMERIVSA